MFLNWPPDHTIVISSGCVLRFNKKNFDYSYLFCFCLSTSEFDEIFQDMIMHYILRTEQYIQLFRIFISDDKKFDHSFLLFTFLQIFQQLTWMTEKILNSWRRTPAIYQNNNKIVFQDKEFSKNEVKWRLGLQFGHQCVQYMELFIKTSFNSRRSRIYFIGMSNCEKLVKRSLKQW